MASGNRRPRRGPRGPRAVKDTGSVVKSRPPHPFAAGWGASQPVGAHDLLAQQSMVVCVKCNRILAEHLCEVLAEGGREWACCLQCAPDDARRVVSRARSNWRYHLSRTLR